MSEIVDLNARYEELFGKETYPNIYAPDDEVYNNLRQEIMSAKREYNPTRTYPFSNIKLYPYEEYLRHKIIAETENNGYRVFFINKYNGKNQEVYAAAYYEPKTSQFFVLKCSFCKETHYFEVLTSSLELHKRKRFMSNFYIRDGVIHQTTTSVYESASLAASYFLGTKSNFLEWKDKRGKTLDAYYSKYNTSSINEKEEKTFPAFISTFCMQNTDEKNFKRNLLTRILEALAANAQKRSCEI